MTPDPSRRDALRLGVASVPMLAGCTGSDEDEGTPHPDDGTDSYGVRLENRAPETYEPPTPNKYGHPVTEPSDLIFEIELKVEYPWSDEDPPWEKPVSIDPGETKAWESVITEEREQVLVANLAEDIVSGYCDATGATYWITPGSENAPDVRYLVVVVDYTYASKADKQETNPDDVQKAPVMYVDHDELTHEWEKPGEDGPFARDLC